MWTLRLRGPKGKAATMRVAPDATLRVLCDLAAAELAIKAGKNLSLTFRSGFPPRAVEYSFDDAVHTKFANNDTIVVDTATPGAEPRQAVAPQAAAAAAPKGRTATRGVAASVAKATAQARASAKAKPKEPPVRAGVHTLHGAAKPQVTPASQKRKERGDGVRLGASLDEESVVVDAALDEEPSKYRRTRAVQLSSKDDIGIKLVEAVSGKSKDRVGKFFRAATKSAVEHQYEMTLANARLNAALARQFEIQLVYGTQPRVMESGSGEEAAPAPSSEMRVKFKESARKWKEETVTLFQPLELQAALKYILISGGETGREMLKPFNMAQVSPRVFWNIARLYNGDVEAGLAALVPDEDWSYLDTRSRQMSKKAMEAKANEEVYKRWKETGTTQERDHEPAVPRRAVPRRPAAATSATAAQDVIEINSDSDDGAEEKAATSDQQLQQAVAYAEQAEKRSLREAMARAAAVRLEVRARSQEVSAAIRESRSQGVTPRDDADKAEFDGEGEEEDDEDEDVEKTTTVYCDACGKARILSLPEAATLGISDDEVGAEWMCAKLALVGRADATCDAIDDEVEQIAGAKLAQLLQSQAGIRTRQELANASLAAALRGLSHPLDPNYAETKTKLDEIVNEARLDEINDTMAEIVGGGDDNNSDLIGLLELQKLGTPADLVETPTDLVAAAVASHRTRVQVEEVRRWQQEARQRIARFAWMGEWRTI